MEGGEQEKDKAMGKGAKGGEEAKLDMGEGRGKETRSTKQTKH